MGNDSDSAAAFSRAVQIDPGCASCWNYLGLALDRLENYTGAVDAFDRAIQIDPNYFDPWNNKGITLVKGFADLEEAVKCFNRAIEIDPDRMQAYVNKANVLRLENRTAEADEVMQMAAELGYKG
jgi:tetratricopeptide (TPR) repeat protein